VSSDHIDQVAAKASRKLGFIRRNLRGAPVDCKKLAYVTLVRSGMEYASIIWHPYTKRNSLISWRKLSGLQPGGSSPLIRGKPLNQCRHFTSAATVGVVSRETPGSEIGLHV